MGSSFRAVNTTRRWISVWLTLLSIFLIVRISAALAAEPVGAGFRDFAYPVGTGGDSAPTGEDPESKLWWNDGVWWAILWSSSGNAYHIHRLDDATEDWVDTGTAVDGRLDTRADTLWDGQNLYVVSHVFALEAGVRAPARERGTLYRYTYDAETRTYTLNSGFPVEVNKGKSETLVLEKDSLGQLWVTYTEKQQVMINHSLNGDDRVWGTPFVLPAGSAANVTSDDISSIIAFDGRIGVMWSNQATKKIYFAVHQDSSSANDWQTLAAYPSSTDDQINLKALQNDSAGRVIAAFKTSDPSYPLNLLVCGDMLTNCTLGSDWTVYPVYDGEFNPTHPIVLIDSDYRQLYVFARNTDANLESAIYFKSTSLDNIAFPSGIGTPFIQSAADIDINDPTSTKQGVNTATGLVVLASNAPTRRYLHNHSLSITLDTDKTVTATSISRAPDRGPTGSPPDSKVAEGGGAGSAVRSFARAAVEYTGSELIFSAMGDVPYSSSEVAILQQQIADHNRVSPSVLMAHVGDIKSGSSACVASAYSSVANILKQLIVPTYIVPGDNEYNDCSNPTAAWALWEQFFTDFEQNFANPPPTERQSIRHENFAFTKNGVLLIGINLVGGRVQSQSEWNQRMQDDADWVSQQFQQKKALVRGAVTFAQAGPNTNRNLFFTQFRAAAASFGKPVLFLHGDGHSWKKDHPFPEPNILRVQVDNGGAEEPVQVTVTLDSQNMFVFKRNPLSSSNAKPTASNVTISGTAQVGQVLAGNYSYSDADGDLQGSSTFRWLRNGTPISGATAQSYTLVAADLNAMISFEVTPVAQSGTSPGVPVTSAAVGPVAPAGGTGGSVVHQQTVTGGSSSSNTVATSAALTGVSGHLYLAAISTRPNVAVSTVSGLGLTWTPVANQCSGRNQTGVTVFRAQGTPSGGVVTATLGATATNAVISVSRYSSATIPIGNAIAGNTRGLSGACSGGTDSGAYSFDLTTTVGGAVVYGAAALRNRTHTPGAGYTERSDLRQGSGGTIAGIASEDRPVASISTVAIDGTLSNTVDWAVIGLEIRP